MHQDPQAGTGKTSTEICIYSSGICLSSGKINEAVNVFESPQFMFIVGNVQMSYK